MSSKWIDSDPSNILMSSLFMRVCLLKLIMCAKSSDVKPTLRNVIGEVLLSASDMNECGIISETFEMVIHLVGFTSLRLLITKLFTLIEGL